MRFAVIGGGPAGYSAALEAIKFGWDVILFEKAQMGGTCLNRGCVPTKYLAHAAQTLEQIRKASQDGITVSNPQVDFSRMQERKDQIVSTLRERLIQQLQSNRIQMVFGPAHLLDENSVQCGDTVYKMDAVLVATGARPAPSIVLGAQNSDHLLACEEIPKKLHILGGGVIAVEFAALFQALGSQVTLTIRGSRILRKWDREIALAITQRLKSQGVIIQTNRDFNQVEPEKEAFVLSALGRIPYLGDLNPSFFTIGPQGGICADLCGKTKTRTIYAAGDVLENAPQLAHVSMEQGKRVVWTLAGIAATQTTAVVQCIFAGQEAASVGLTEEEAKGKGIPVVSAKQTMYSNARTMMSSGERGFVKLLADVSSGKLLGAQWLGERAGDLIAELALAINQGITVSELQASTRPHPSYCESVTEAAETLMEKLS